MKNIILIIGCILLFFAGCRKKQSNTQEWTFHTTPNKWEEPRIFHTPFDNERLARISIERIPTIEVESEKSFSPNGAYWFSVINPDYSKSMIRNVQIDIYNERDYLISLQLLEIGNYVIHTNWVNEKIIYVRAWWGRVLGVDLLFDVETEQIIYREFVNDGGLAYMQWQQARND